MIYLHKSLPLIFGPITIIIFLIIFGLLLKKYLLAWFAVILLVLGSLPIVANNFVKALEGGLIHRDIGEVGSADAIVVTGGMLKSIITSQGVGLEWIDPDRFFGGIDLALANKAHYLIFSGGKLPWENNLKNEGEFLRQKALTYGVSEKRILVTQPAQNTNDEAIAVRALLEEKLGPASKNIILVTSAFHMTRAKELFEQKSFVVTPYPVDFKLDISDVTPMHFMPSAYALKDVEFSLREIIGRLYYSVYYFDKLQKP